MARWPETTVSQRFWRKVGRTGAADCWQWKGAKLRQGYGQFRTGRHSHVLAHRFAYSELRGSIPEGFVIDHLCRNPSCVNPAHMEIVTNAENVQRGLAGARNRFKTHCKHGHEFTPENTHVYPDTGKRRCKTCARRWTKELRLRQQAQPPTRS